MSLPQDAVLLEEAAPVWVPCIVTRPASKHAPLWAPPSTGSQILLGVSYFLHGLPMESQQSLGNPLIQWRVLPGLQMNLCSTINLCGLQGDSLPHHGLHQGPICKTGDLKKFLRAGKRQILHPSLAKKRCSKEQQTNDQIFLRKMQEGKCQDPKGTTGLWMAFNHSPCSGSPCCKIPVFSPASGPIPSPILKAAFLTFWLDFSAGSRPNYLGCIIGS